MSVRLRWTTSELDQLSVILTEYQQTMLRRAEEIRLDYPYAGSGFADTLHTWAERAADLRDKIERR